MFVGEGTCRGFWAISAAECSLSLDESSALLATSSHECGDVQNKIVIWHLSGVFQSRIDGKGNLFGWSCRQLKKRGPKKNGWFDYLTTCREPKAHSYRCAG